MSAFLLVHSPLVGPQTWEGVAAALRDGGHQVVVPRLAYPGAGSGFAEAFAASVVDEVRDAGLVEAPWVVGHSAAGAYLPLVRAALDVRPAGNVFVDARLPDGEGRSLIEASTGAFAGLLRELADGGWLPPWPSWFGERAMRELIPDQRTREGFVAGCPRVPLALFEEAIAVPAGWDAHPCFYLKLSGGYESEADAARAAKWPVHNFGGGHLAMLNEPARLAELLIDLAERASASP